MPKSIRLSTRAERDLGEIHAFISREAAPAVARGYLARILNYLEGFDVFPERGALRDDIRPGLRIFGFERRVSVAFIVEEDDIVILRILYAGRQFEGENDHPK